jgi:hypothetical protein
LSFPFLVFRHRLTENLKPATSFLLSYISKPFAKTIVGRDHTFGVKGKVFGEAGMMASYD